MCDGTKEFKHSGYHNPLEPYKWKSCPYCDHEGTVLIEAGQYAIEEYVAQLPRSDCLRLIARMNGVNE